MKTLFFGSGPIGRLYAYLFYKAGMAMLRSNCSTQQLHIPRRRYTPLQKDTQVIYISSSI
jgi:hypothetical protein